MVYNVVVDVVKFRGLFFIQVQFRSVTELRSYRKWVCSVYYCAAPPLQLTQLLTSICPLKSNWWCLAMIIAINAPPSSVIHFHLITFRNELISRCRCYCSLFLGKDLVSMSWGFEISLVKDFLRAVVVGHQEILFPVQ